MLTEPNMAGSRLSLARKRSRWMTSLEMARNARRKSEKRSPWLGLGLGLGLGLALGLALALAPGLGLGSV